MRKALKIVCVVALVALGAALVVIPQFAATQPQAQSPAMDHSAANPSEPVPAFHAQPPTGDLPPTMEPSIYRDKLVFNAYVVAGRVKKVLYQEPCYCHCDRSNGHGSLLDCFVGTHGSGCDICQESLITFTSKPIRAGKPLRKSAKESCSGDWQKVVIAKYEKDYLSPQ